MHPEYNARLPASRALFQFSRNDLAMRCLRYRPEKFRDLLYPVLCAALFFECGCSTKNLNSAKDAAAFSSPSELTAALTNGDIVLHWKNNAEADGGNWVEFATPGSEYIKLGVFLSDAKETSFLHPRVAPETTFLYHIQPFFGRATKPVEITSGVATNGAPVLNEGPIDSTNEISTVNPPKYSIRSLPTFVRATPRDLTATLSSPFSVELHWRDCASDEEGYCLEVGEQPNGKFRVCALLPPDSTSFRKTGLNPQTKYYFRVRAFFYGKPSDTASVVTAAR